ncbi:MAG: MarR family winged helix-turn-helix transcriptional regulator [Clostridia bacterium]|nr:MarR family winged helix-turn-helix transcriptional regulator [Clostridia bacterium]
MSKKITGHDFSENHANMMDYMLTIHNITKNLSEICFNKNGKNNKDSLTFQQYSVLELVNDLGDDCILNKLASKNCVSKASFSIMISKLECLGYIKRDNCFDRRSSKIRLTEKGKNAYFSKKEEVEEYLANLFNETLDEDDIKTLEETMPRVKKVFDKFKK